MYHHQLPNLISLIRLLLVAPSVSLFLNQNYLLTLLLVVVISVSDGIDGFLARKFGWVSDFGSILDPIADKVLIVIFFILFGLHGLIPIELMAVVIIRDFLILYGYINMRMLGNKTIIAPDPLSKINTFFEFILIVIIIGSQIASLPALVFEITGAIVVALSFTSLIKYSLMWSKVLIKMILC
jgi:cardiolipin synthase (CMP-forming)